MNSFKTKGIILKSNNVGEADKIVKILTPEHGVIDVSVRGARKMRSRFASSTQIFTFAEFVLESGRNMYFLHSADIIESFSELVLDTVKLAYAAHFARLILMVVQAEQESVEALYLVLQSIYELLRARIPENLLCVIFELKLACISGFVPTLRDKDGEHMFCGEILLNGTVLAIEYIIRTDPRKVFSFGVNADVLKQLDRLTQKYLKEVLDCKRDIDDYIKTLS